jgi:hypothetical protein
LLQLIGRFDWKQTFIAWGFSFPYFCLPLTHCHPTEAAAAAGNVGCEPFASSGESVCSNDEKT